MRNAIAGRRAAEEKEDDQEDIEMSLRGKMGRKEAAQLQELLQRQAKQAVRLQALLRGKMGRKEAKQVAELRTQQQEAAVQLQALMRGVQGRGQAAAAAMEKQRSGAKRKAQEAMAEVSPRSSKKKRSMLDGTMGQWWVGKRVRAKVDGKWCSGTVQAGADSVEQVVRYDNGESEVVGLPDATVEEEGEFDEAALTAELMELRMTDLKKLMKKGGFSDADLKCRKAQLVERAVAKTKAVQQPVRRSARKSMGGQQCHQYRHPGGRGNVAPTDGKIALLESNMDTDGEALL